MTGSPTEVVVADVAVVMAVAVATGVALVVLAKNFGPVNSSHHCTR